jgi:glycosyltransferase involved in cell wall biosynthesis
MVVLLVNKYFFEKGGSERYFFVQSDALAERGHDVVHFSMQHPDNRPSPWARYFVSTRNYNDPRGASRLRAGTSFVRSREAAERIEELVEASRPEVAHLHNIYHQITPSIIPVLRRRGIPVFMTLHDYKLICPNYTMFAQGKYCDRCVGGRFYHAPIMRCHESSFARSALLAFEAYWQRISAVYDGVHTFLAPSRYMRDAFIRAGFDEDRVRYLPSFLPEPEAPRAGAAAPALPDSYLLYFGRLSEEKGLRTLLAALHAKPDVHLVVCGDGPLRAELESLAASHDMHNVRFMGHLDKGRLDAVVAGARAVVLPAEWPENAPFAVLEAAVQGVPVIVSDMGGLPEMAEIVGGSVFRGGDRAALASAIDAVWADPDSARARAAAGRVALVEHYDRERHMSALESMYTSAQRGGRA